MWIESPPVLFRTCLRIGVKMHPSRVGERNSVHHAWEANLEGGSHE